MDGDSPNPPRIFANHVILQLAEHTLGEGVELEYDDFIAIRVAFRKLGGSWIALGDGDLEQVELLSKVLNAWSNSRRESKKEERIV